MSKIKLKVTFLYSEMEKQCCFKVKNNGWFDIHLMCCKHWKTAEKDRTENRKKLKRTADSHIKLWRQLDSNCALIKKLQEVHTIVKDFSKRSENQWFLEMAYTIGAGDAVVLECTGYAWGKKGMAAGVVGQLCNICRCTEFEIKLCFSRERTLRQDVS